MKKERKERAKEEDALEDVLREVERDREGEDALAGAVSRGRAARDKGAAEEADKDGGRRDWPGPGSAAAMEALELRPERSVAWLLFASCSKQPICNGRWQWEMYGRGRSANQEHGFEFRNLRKFRATGSSVLTR